MPNLKIYNQEVTDKDALLALEKLKVNPRFKSDLADGNLMPDEVKKIELPNGASKLELKSASLVGLTTKEYVAFVVEAHSKAAGAVSMQDYLEFMKEVVKTSPTSLAPAEAPKSLEAEGKTEQRSVIGRHFYQKGAEQLVSQLGYDLKKFPLTLPKDAEAQLIDQAKRNVPPYIIGEIPLRQNLYYPVVIEERSSDKVTATIPNIKNQSELSEFAKSFPKSEDLEKRLGAGYRILNSGFVSRGDFYVYASNGQQGKVLSLIKNELKEMPQVHHVTPVGASNQVEVFLINGRAYNFPDPARSTSNGMHLVTTRLVPLPYQ